MAGDFGTWKKNDHCTQILVAKRATPQADTSKWKGEIDQLALRGQLYGLTEDDVKIVEGKKWRKSLHQKPGYQLQLQLLLDFVPYLPH